MENNYEKSAPVMHVKEWIITNVIAIIPIVGFIMLFVWAFGCKDINENKKNWAKSLLIIELICIALVVLIYGIFIAFALAAWNQGTKILE